MFICSWGPSSRQRGNHAEETIYVENECCIFPEQILYRIKKQENFVKEIKMISLPVVDIEEDDARGHKFLPVLPGAQVSVMRIRSISPTWKIEEKVGNLYFLQDGTPYSEYLEHMRDEELLKAWWGSSPSLCTKFEELDARLQETYGVTFGKDRIPIPSSLSHNNVYLTYRGPSIKLLFPVYKKIREESGNERREVLYKFSHMRTLFKFAAFYRVLDVPAVYKYGGHHTFTRSGRRFVGNPWFNSIGHEYILGVPFEDIFGQRFPQCPKFWNWQYHHGRGWSSHPIEEWN
jgi:hypothetical protein